jgi:hypothetical protein
MLYRFLLILVHNNEQEDLKLMMRMNSSHLCSKSSRFPTSDFSHNLQKRNKDCDDQELAALRRLKLTRGTFAGGDANSEIYGGSTTT